MNFKSLLFLLILFSSAPAAAELSINEIMYAPNSNGGGENNEWIELFNNGTSETDITDWTIDGKPIPQATVAPQGYLILAKNSTKFLEIYNRSSVRVPFTLSNNGEIINITDKNGSMKDVFDYIGYAATNLAKNNNRSLERNGSEWFESIAPGGTPGARNSILSEENQEQQNESSGSQSEAENSGTNNSLQNGEYASPEIEIVRAPSSLKFGDYASIHARFNSGSKSFGRVRFVAYVYKPSWITRDITSDETTLRNSPYNSNVAAEASDITKNETFYIVLPLFVKCNEGGYADTAYTARVRAYGYEAGEWKPVADADKEVYVSGENDACKKQAAKETVCINKTIEKECTEKEGIVNEGALEINISYPETTFAGENFTTNVSIKNGGNALRDLEAYSYIYEHSQIISSGFDGAKWGNARAANSRKVSLEGNNSTTLELINRARENVSAEKYTYKIRIDDLNDDKKSEERIYLIEVKSRDLKNETAFNITENEDKITGALVLENARAPKLSFWDRIIYKIKSWLES